MRYGKYPLWCELADAVLTCVLGFNRWHCVRIRLHADRIEVALQAFNGYIMFDIYPHV
jgi:hypothetical protein